MSDNNCPSYSHCYKGFCTCRYELTGDGEKCTPHAPKRCSADKDCKAKQGKCIERYCRCVGMFAGNGVYCRKAKSCPKNVKCGSNATCMIDDLYPKKPVCVCDPGFWKNKDGKCVDCLSNTHCTKTYSICVEGKCTCKQELILGKTSCEAAPLHVCKSDKDCDSRAKCEEGKCICQGNTTGNGKYCRDKTSCPKNFNCGVGYDECYRDPIMPKKPVCHCLKGFKNSKDGKCVECFDNSECKYGQCGAFGMCFCGLGQIKEKKTCKPAPLHPCKTKRDCHKNGDCHRGKCHCVGKTLTGDGKWCRKSLPCPAEHEEKCKAAGPGVVSCVVDPYWTDQPRCKCHMDFKTSEAGICVEITECEKNGLVCSTGEVCKQGNGTYGCFCRDGYEEILSGGNRTCQDIDECKQEPCSAIANSVCVNVEGSYKCECNKGFHKNADGSACEAGCNCGANQVCEEDICKCSPGFIESSDGAGCDDVDECFQDEDACSGANEECVNEQGTYSCECQSGYVKKDGVCVKKDECNCKRHEVCRKGKCKCKRGYKKNAKGHCHPRASVLEAQAGSGRLFDVSSYLSALILGILGRLAFTA